MSVLNVRIKVGTPYNHQSNPIERFHEALRSLLKAKKANGENNWGKSLPTLILAYNNIILAYNNIILAYNATQHYSPLCSPAACIV